METKLKLPEATVHLLERASRHDAFGDHPNMTETLSLEKQLRKLFAEWDESSISCDDERSIYDAAYDVYGDILSVISLPVFQSELADALAVLK